MTPVKTSTGRTVKSYPAPLGWWADARPQASPVERIRAVGHRLGWLPNDLPDLATFRRNPQARRTAVRKMLSDEAVKAGLLQKVFGVAQLTLESKPADQNSPTDVDAAEFRRFVIEERLPYGLPGLIEAVGFHALIEDHSLCEPIWPAPGELEPTGRWKGKRVLSDIKARPPSSYWLDRDPHDTITAVRYTSDDGQMVTDDPASFIIFRYLTLYSSPMSGYTDVEAAYNHFLAKVSCIRLRAIFEDRLAGGFLSAKAANPNDPGLKEDLAAARGCGYIVLPIGSELEVLDLSSSANDTFRNSIEDKNKAILIALTGGYLHVLESTGRNPRGDAKVSLSGAELLQWHFASSISATLTHQLGPMIDAENFAGAGKGTLRLSSIDPGFNKKVLENGLIVRQAGVPMSVSEWYRNSGWGPPKDAADTLATMAAADPFGGLPQDNPVDDPFKGDK